MSANREPLLKALESFGMVVAAVSGVLLYWALWAAVIYIPCHFVAKYW
jgi:hypothetical protein